MYLDKELEFSSAQVVTTSAASTNVIDTSVYGDAHTELFLRVGVPIAMENGTSVTFVLQTDTVENFASATDLYTSAAIVTASLTAGAEPVRVRVPKGAERYLRVYYTVSGTYSGGGALDAHLVRDLQDNDRYLGS